jgi:hypothetical protein
MPLFNNLGIITGSIYLYKDGNSLASSSRLVISPDFSNIGKYNFIYETTGSTPIKLLTLSSSGTDPRVGIGNENPQTTLDIKDVSDTAVGAEILVRSARITKGGDVGDAAGKILFVIDSGSYNDIKTSGSVAIITTEVTAIDDKMAGGDLIFKVSDKNLSDPEPSTVLRLFRNTGDISLTNNFATMSAALHVIDNITSTNIVKGSSLTSTTSATIGTFVYADNIRIGTNTAPTSKGLYVSGNITSSNDLSIRGFSSVSASLASTARFPYTGSALITGSLTVTGSTTSTSGFTGSLLGTSSWAQSASNAINAQTASFLPVATYNITASWAQSASNAVNARTASFVNNLNQDLSITGAVILSGSPSPELRVIGDTQFTGSVGSTGGFTGSLLGTSSWATNALTASFLPVGTYNITASWATNALTASFLPVGTYNITASWAQSASNAINARTASFLPVGTYNITSSWATNALTASFLSVGTYNITASWAQSASNAINARTASFINNLNQNLSITGAVVLSGSSLPELRVIGETQFTGSVGSTGGFTGSLLGTASWATNALTASFAPNYVLTSVTSSMLAPYVPNSQTSSFVQNSQTSSMLAPYVPNSQTSSFVRNSQTSSMTVLSSSFAQTASFLPVGTYNITSSWATNALTASFAPNYVLTSVTSSMLAPYMLTSVTSSMLAPYVPNSQTSSFVQNSQTSSMLAPYVLTSVTSSMLAPYVPNSQTSSFVRNSQTSSMTVLSSSFSQTASFLPVGIYNITASWATNALTASFVNTLNQNLIITGTVSIGTSSIGPNENTLTLGARDTTSEGGQLGLNAPGGTYTSASFIDLYQNRFRVLRGTNASSDAELFSINLHTGQLVANRYTGSGAFPGTAAGYLAVDTAGNVITAAGVGGGVTQIVAGTNISISPAGGTGIVTINSTGGSGTTFPYTGSAIISGSLIITGSTTSTGGFTGSLLGTASQALTASFALNTPPPPNQPLLFIYTSSTSLPSSIPSGYVYQEDGPGIDYLYVSTQSYNNVNLAPIGFASYYFTEIGSLVTLRATGSGAFRTYRVIGYNSSTNYSQYTTQLTTTIASGTINNGDTVEFRWDKSAEVGNLSEGLFIDVFNTYNNEGIDIYFGTGLSIAPGITNTSILSYTGSGYIAAAITKSANLTINSLNATQGLTGSLLGTSSWANNATTASYVLNAVSSSFSSTASFTPNAITTASVNLNTITFTKGSGSTYNITDNTGSGGGVTINNNVSGYVVTATGTANTLNGESGLTFDGTTLTVGGNAVITAIDVRDDPSTTIGEYAVGSHIARDWPAAGGPALTAGNIVYFSGSSQWTNAQANATGSSTRVLGVVTSNTDPNEIVLQGTITINTDLASYSIGQPVYLSPISGGRVTNVPPSSSGHVARYVGWVVDTSRDQIYFNPDFTYIQL